jgi:hypothetical protein
MNTFYFFLAKNNNNNNLQLKHQTLNHQMLGKMSQESSFYKIEQINKGKLFEYISRKRYTLIFLKKIVVKHLNN